MELLQKRDFSTFFSDTFKFIKENWKHFFTNYFIINGIFLLLTLVKNYFDGIGYTFPFLVEMIYLLLVLFFGMINWTFVTVYMILYNERRTDFDYMDIINSFKENIGKIIVFILISILVAIPVIIVFYIAAFLLAITIVGILLLPLLYASLIIWYSLAFYEYLNSEKGIFDCFGYGFTLFTKKFWATTGSTALLYLIILIVYAVGLGATGVIGSFFEMNMNDPTSSILAMQSVFSSPATLIMLTVLSILMVIVQISQGIIYYSQKELLENINANRNIDSIGKIEE